MLEPFILEGGFVRLEPLAMDHAEALARAGNAPAGTYRYTTVPCDLDSAVTDIETALAEARAGKSVPFATVDRRSGLVVGATRFCYMEFWDWPSGSAYQRGIDVPDVVEIGYTWLNPTAQRTGINTEAKLLMLTHAFEVWKVHRVRLKTDARNNASRRAIERLGMRFDGVLRASRIAADGEIRDNAFYSMLDREWPEAKAALTAKLRDR
jgi:RimJ/RimL family protein N-acetyltransferase